MAGSSIWTGEVVVFGGAFLVSLVITPIVRSVAVRWRLGNKPNGRGARSHSIPHLGGVALFLGVAAGIALALWRGALDGGSARLIVRAAPAVVLIVTLGLVDDMRNLAARRKLAFQVLAAGSLVAVGFRLLTGMWVFDASAAALAVVSMFFVVGMLSSVNLVDGHDGLAAGIALISASAFAVIASMIGASVVVIVSLAICGACLGFLVFNFPPGRIYMGDTGSMLLGLMLAIVACLVSMRSPSSYTFAAVCLVLGVPLLDTVLAIARRIVLRSPLFGADNLHMHHVLRAAGLSARQTLVVLYGLQIVFAALGIAAAAGWILAVMVGLALVTVAFVAFLRTMVEGREAPAPVTHLPAPTTIPFQSSFSTNIPHRRTSVGP